MTDLPKTLWTFYDPVFETYVTNDHGDERYTPDHAEQFTLTTHSDALVAAAYEDAAKCSYHNTDKEPDYPYDIRGALKSTYKDDFGDVKDPDAFAGQIALHDAWQAEQDILALTPAKAQAAYDAAITQARREGWEAAQAENAKLREALNVIATHRAKCHEYDTDCGHEKRSFDEEDVRLMEWQAKSALSGQDAEGEM
ncbi:hypothetical protein [Sulfitobacter pacificus]|uniref:hypothetical protein n=1 Tax=Sulfitobacter pacificus TaxID=1499314 RepID=UPI0031048198